jgi:hypothetical protein
LSVDQSKFRRKMREMETLVHERLTKAVERWADRVVAEMRAMLAISWPALAADVTIDWTWGDAPSGAISVGRASKGREYDQLTVTIYARAQSRSGISATWFEFGTANRVQVTTGRQTGRITANPFFFPVYRANKSRVQSGLRSTLRTAIKRINAS